MTSGFPDRAAAQGALAGPLGESANHFFRGATAKCTDFKVTHLPDRVRLEYFAPARNAGYGKRYIQELDNAGRVICEYKETWGPNGLIETKWVHGAPE